MTRITLEYFARLRDEAGCPRETLETGAGSLSELYDVLVQKHGFTLPKSRLRVAVNAVFSDWDRRPEAGDHVVFIPPVSGG